jgi:hypothetical protein
MASITWKRTKLISHTVTSAEQTASGVVISVVSGGSADDFHFIGQLQRAGVNITTSIAYVYASGTGNLTVGGPVQTNDKVRIIGTFV